MKKASNNQTKDKRIDSVTGETNNILDRNELTVQPLATEAAGKGEKYERTGPQEFVPFPSEEVTMEKIIKACNEHFKDRLKGMVCNILETERGPSCSRYANYQTSS